MRQRLLGVLATVSIIVVAFAFVVIGLAAAQDYRLNRGDSFVERIPALLGGEGESVRVTVIQSSEEPVEELENVDRRKAEIEKELVELKRRFDSFPDFPRFAERREREERFEPFEDFSFDRFEFNRTDWIDGLVERGVMSRKDADEFKAWFEDLPDSLGEEFPEFAGERDFEFDTDDGRFRFRWRWDSSDDDWFFESHPEYDKDDKNGV